MFLSDTSTFGQSREPRYFQHLTLALLEIRMTRSEISVTDTLYQSTPLEETR